MKDAYGCEIVVTADGAKVAIDDGSASNKAYVFVANPKAAEALAADLRAVFEKHLA